MKHIVIFTEIFSTWTFRLLRLLMVKTYRTEMDVDDWSKPIVIVANHSSMMDPFIITSCIPYARFVKLVPFRFLVANRFFRYLPLLPFLYSHGCFPAKKQPGRKSGLDFALELAKDNQTITIFPEGKVSRFDRRYTPKRGIEALSKLPGTKLVPVRIKRSQKRKFFNSYSLSIGRPFDGKHMTAEQIMDVVYSLKFR